MGQPNQAEDCDRGAGNKRKARGHDASADGHGHYINSVCVLSPICPAASKARLFAYLFSLGRSGEKINSPPTMKLFRRKSEGWKYAMVEFAPC